MHNASNDNDPTRATILLLGGTGKTGRRIAARLAERGVAARLGSRSSALRFDWDDASTWRPALEGIRTMYIAYYPDLAAPGAAEKLGAIAKASVLAGVTRIVLLSGRGEPQAVVSEEAVRASGIGLTVLRAAWFAQNFSEGAFAESIAHGEFALPGPANVGEPFIDVDDLADVAVTAILDESHVGKVWELTGPRVVTLDGVASELSQASGKPVRFVPVTTSEFTAAVTPLVGPEYASFMGELFTFLLDGHNASVTDHVERILGRKPRDFRQFAAAAAS